MASVGDFCFQTNEPDGEQNAFMVNFSDNSDLRRRFTAILRNLIKIIIHLLILRVLHMQMLTRSLKCNNLTA